MRFQPLALPAVGTEPGTRAVGAPAGAAPAGATPGFAERFREALVEANQSLQTAEQSARDLAAGKADVVETAIALSHAELSLRHVVALRDRVFEAYQEIMRLQL